MAFAVRYFNIVPSYNLFIDEVTYSEIARNIAEGEGVTSYDEPFTLHPPAALAVFGLATKVLGLQGDPADLAYALRPVAALFGAATVALTYLIARRLALPSGFALAAAALVMLDPFQIRYDSQVMLEAQTQFFAALTILLVITRSPGLAGLSAGITFCSKETFGLVLGAALLVMLFSNRPIPRPQTLKVIGIGLSLYLGNLLATIWLGGLDAWAQSRGNGLTRLIGLNQETGFNSDTVQVSLFSRLTEHFDRLAVTYALLLLGGVCCLVLVRRLTLWRPSTAPDAVVATTAWALAACGYLVYAMLFGSIEEQMFYIPLVPCVLCLAVVTAWYDRTRVSALLLALFLTVDVWVWSRVHSADSNIYRQFFTWAETGIPHGSRVAVTEDSAQFVLEQVDLGNWHTPADLSEHDVDYVLINPRLVEHGYGLGDRALLEYLETTAQAVFTKTSEQDGTLILYRLNSAGAS
nr:glycosyltransferase family 39 protein [Kineosporia babensis]